MLEFRVNLLLDKLLSLLPKRNGQKYFTSKLYNCGCHLQGRRVQFFCTLKFILLLLPYT